MWQMVDDELLLLELKIKIVFSGSKRKCYIPGDLSLSF
jgi:hypothetical protein